MAGNLPPGIQSREHQARGARKPRTQYRANVSDPTKRTPAGHPVRVSSRWFDTIAEARAWRDGKAITKATTGRLAADRTIRVTDACEGWLKVAREVGHDGRPPLRAGTADRHDVTIRNTLTPTIGTLRMSELTAPDIKVWVNEQVGERGRKETHRALTLLRRAYDHYVGIGVLIGNPASSIKLSLREDSDEVSGVVSEFMEPDTVVRILRACDELAERGYAGQGMIAARNAGAGHHRARAKAWANRHRPFIYTLFGTGLRYGEAVVLRWRNVDLEAGTITVDSTIDKNGKVRPPKTSSANRTITIGATLAAILRAIPGDHEADHFVFGGSRHPDPKNMRMRGWTFLMQELDLVDEDGDDELLWTPHDSRHYHASFLIDQGMEAQEVCDRLGHSNVTTTLRIYTHLFKARRGRGREQARGITDKLLA